MPETVKQRRRRARRLRKQREYQRDYYARKREDAMPKHETLSNEELDAVLEAARLEKLTYGAERLAKAAGSSVEQWLAQATPEDRDKYKHVPEVLAIWERVDRETRERNARWPPHPPTGP